MLLIKLDQSDIQQAKNIRLMHVSGRTTGGIAELLAGELPEKGGIVPRVCKTRGCGLRSNLSPSCIAPRRVRPDSTETDRREGEDGESIGEDGEVIVADVGEDGAVVGEDRVGGGGDVSSRVVLSWEGTAHMRGTKRYGTDAAKIACRRLEKLNLRRAQLLLSQSLRSSGPLWYHFSACASLANILSQVANPGSIHIANRYLDYSCSAKAYRLWARPLFGQRPLSGHT
jgi:hypothetical protein